MSRDEEVDTYLCRLFTKEEPPLQVRIQAAAVFGSVRNDRSLLKYSTANMLSLSAEDALKLCDPAVTPQQGS